MENTSLIAIALFLLAACGEISNEGKGAQSQQSTGQFSGTLAGEEFKVAVNCSYFDQDYFQFLSDKTDTSDTNEDGIIISGMQNNGKMVLTIIDNGRTFSAGRLSSFAKGDNKAEGSGQLFEEGSADAYDVQFVVTCG